MAKANISNAETQSLFLLFNEHGMHRKNENPFVHLVSSVFMFIMTTDIQNLTDFHHERKRANQIHQIHPFLFSFSNTECTKETKAFVYSVSSVFMFRLTTDIQDLTDANHERKRDNPFNLCYLCSRKRIRCRIIRFIRFLFRKHVAPAFQIHQIHPLPLSRSQAR